MTTRTWRRGDVVRIVVTTVGADGAQQRRNVDIRAGRDEAVMIRLPEGTQAVSIECPLRERVEFGQHRARRSTPPSARPSWRDDSDLFLWLRSWRVERETRRRMQGMRSGYGVSVSGARSHTAR